ncbi:7,8-didemethyl-8-hydroxy-5-deazariboflavin synthase subunit CofG [Cyanobium sp. FACHB-13342]|uniref:7,8-didemethyl-8-hydroxy-5-deazariboflavin synthase subunit CofG n=1 Tax=Cyanobium sp. FACHB-13342 TaxID=2692793 RepID=UPI0016806AE9|nr:7,8-didemethyl-8-hydroxy-5-deazariboflavin synthase subunit CofG [Cyanobium sp. FACHB-13342]MBD2422342.1 7,8-didemethyl-8-hydroxy-5-deazariboflavin synthase subunit CofG [Cyanobium sp. FACHB-13342]
MAPISPADVYRGGGAITWSPSVTLVPTRSCFNACGYCSFRRPANPVDPLADALPDGEARAVLGARPQAAEVLLLSGEVSPSSPHRRAWLARLQALSRLAWAAGRLPHTNAGPLSLAEMAALGRLNASMGLMLEGLGPAYDALHRRAPSKRLEVRLAQLEQAGRLGIPFTSGLLLGVGESQADRREALEVLARLQRRWGHLQEVILQPFRPDGATAERLTAAEQADLLGTIAEARRTLPPEVHLQMPPNLWPLEALPAALAAGIDDLGGIDSGDVINPAYPQPTPTELAAVLARSGYRLVPRLCVHPAWQSWLPAAIQEQARRAESRLLASISSGPWS